MINIRKLESELWESADLLRQGSKLTSSQYCMPVLALLFLRYAYSRYKMVEAEILQGRPMRGGRVMPVEPSDFAALNDVYGHATGDLAIRCVADVILHGIPQGAIPVRYGGDEFLVLLPDIGPEALRTLPESLASSIPARSEELGLPELPGISTGFVLAEACSSKSLEDYIKEADELMYREKKAKKALRPNENR